MKMTTRSIDALAAAGLSSLLFLSACGSDDPAPACDVSGHACTWLGMPGLTGFNGDGHSRLETELYWAMDLMFAVDGTPWFIDWNNHLVRRVKADGTVESVVGGTDPIFPGDGTGDASEKSAEGAPGNTVSLNHPTDLAELPDGTILLMAWHNHKLRSIDPATGRVKILCGGGVGFAGDGGPGAAALMKQPVALQLDDQGNTYIADQGNLRIRKIDPTGLMSTLGGTGMPGFEGDGGPATMAKFSFEGGSNPEPSGGLAFASGKLYVSDTLNDRIRVIDLATGMIETLAGNGEPGFAGDGGPALQAQLRKPHDLEIGPEGDLYVADTDNSRIRAIDLTTGIIRTVAGTGELGLETGEGKLATEIKLRRPFGIAFDKDGHLYVADTINSRIVKVTR